MELGTACGQDAGEPPEVRVALWCCQRSMSTVFERCVAAGGEVEIFHEVYLATYRFGPQHAPENRHFEIDDGFTYHNVREMLCRSYPSKIAVFLKDMAYAVEGRFADLPQNFCHTFLIRSPKEVIRSYLKLLERCDFSEAYIDELRWKLPNSFKQQCALHKFFAAIYSRRPPLVLDADDFLASPERVLRRYCQDTRLSFKEMMLKWESLQSIPEEWHCSAILRKITQETGSYDRVLRSTGVEVPRQQTCGPIADITAEDALPPDWLRCVEECQPFYDQLYAQKLCFSE